jgi:di/tripeptidase
MTTPPLTLEEEILQESGLLLYEDESGAELLGDDRKAALEDARSELQELVGRVTKIDFQGHQVWRAGEDLPTNKGLRIASMFASVREDLAVAYVLGDVRVYAEPKQSLPGDAFTRITINRASPAVLHEALTRSSFVEQVALEIKALMELEEEIFECPSCGEPVPEDNLFCGQCGAKMPEEEEEPSPTTSQATTVPS